MQKQNFNKLERVPHDTKRNYDEDFVEKRRKWLSKRTNVKFSHISHYSFKPKEIKGNVENFVGTAQVPLGIMGPLAIKGRFAKGVFYVPLATTEGALLNTYMRGAIAATKAGGVKVSIYKDENHVSPVFLFNSLKESEKFIIWVTNNFTLLKNKVKKVTGHGKLLSVVPYILGRQVTLRFSYYTQDAMGANMIGIVTDEICRFISEHVKLKRYLLRSNLSSEKKASGVNLLIGYGKEVSAEVVIPKNVVSMYLNSSPEDIHTAWHSWTLGCVHANMVGGNAHFANGLAAIFIACGQDVAHVTNASVGITVLDTTDSGDLYVAVKLPNILVGTVGGGTALGTQRECLEMLGCYGQGESSKFAEIIAATLLAGEIGICAGITSEYFLKPHINSRVHTREKAFYQNQI